MHWICKYFESSNNSKPKSNIFPIFPSDICWWITLALDLWFNVSSFPPPPQYICKLQGATWTTTTAWACSATCLVTCSATACSATVTTATCSTATTPAWWATAAATPSPGENTYQSCQPTFAKFTVAGKGSFYYRVFSYLKVPTSAFTFETLWPFIHGK